MTAKGSIHHHIDVPITFAQRVIHQIVALGFEIAGEDEASLSLEHLQIVEEGNFFVLDTRRVFGSTVAGLSRNRVIASLEIKKEPHPVQRGVDGSCQVRVKGVDCLPRVTQLFEQVIERVPAEVIIHLRIADASAVKWQSAT